LLHEVAVDDDDNRVFGVQRLHIYDFPNWEVRFESTMMKTVEELTTEVARLEKLADPHLFEELERFRETNVELRKEVEKERSKGQALLRTCEELRQELDTNKNCLQVEKSRTLQANEDFHALQLSTAEEKKKLTLERDTARVNACGALAAQLENEVYQRELKLKDVGRIYAIMELKSTAALSKEKFHTLDGLLRQAIAEKQLLGEQSKLYVKELKELVSCYNSLREENILLREQLSTVLEDDTQAAKYAKQLNILKIRIKEQYEAIQAQEKAKAADEERIEKLESQVKELRLREKELVKNPREAEEFKARAIKEKKTQEHVYAVDEGKREILEDDELREVTAPSVPSTPFSMKDFPQQNADEEVEETKENDESVSPEKIGARRPRRKAAKRALKEIQSTPRNTKHEKPRPVKRRKATTPIEPPQEEDEENFFPEANEHVLEAAAKISKAKPKPKPKKNETKAPRRAFLAAKKPAEHQSLFATFVDSSKFQAPKLKKAK